MAWIGRRCGGGGARRRCRWPRATTRVRATAIDRHLDVDDHHHGAVDHHHDHDRAADHDHHGAATDHHRGPDLDHPPPPGPGGAAAGVGPYATVGADHAAPPVRPRRGDRVPRVGAGRRPGPGRGGDLGPLVPPGDTRPGHDAAGRGGHRRRAGPRGAGPRHRHRAPGGHLHAVLRQRRPVRGDRARRPSWVAGEGPAHRGPGPHGRAAGRGRRHPPGGAGPRPAVPLRGRGRHRGRRPGRTCTSRSIDPTVPDRPTGPGCP